MQEQAKPTVSVIMPAFNAAEYIALAIDSVLAQTYPAWQLIVVDDGSTDETGAIADSYADGRIRVIHQDNAGLPAARNAGIDQASGQYLAFLDSDDEWTPRFLERSLEALAANKQPDVVGVYSSYVHIDGKGNILPQPGNRVYPTDGLYQRMLCGNFFPPCVAVVRADVVRTCGCFDASLPGTGCEDLDLWLRILKTHTMIGVDKPLARYRLHGDNMSSDPVGMQTNRMAVMAKHFGPPAGDPREWPDDKRIAYAHRYLGSALEYLGAGLVDQGWTLLSESLKISADLALQMNTYFRAIHSPFPRGYRGTTSAGELPSAESLMIRVAAACTKAGLTGKHVRLAKAAAYQALALTCDIDGDWAQGRGLQWHAMCGNNDLMVDTAAWRRLLKMCLGTRVGHAVRRSRARTALPQQSSANKDRAT